MNDSAQRYPLSWPAGWARTPAGDRQRASFQQSRTTVEVVNGATVKARVASAISTNTATERLEKQLDALGATHTLLSTNVRLRLDGRPNAKEVDPYDVGVAIYFRLHDKPIVFACDRWVRVADNIAAIANHIDALRRLDRYGVGRMEQAFAGYAALPPTAVDWAIVLGVSSDATREVIISAHRRLAAQHHPDKGGRFEDMARINEARDRALQSR